MTHADTTPEAAEAPPFLSRTLGNLAAVWGVVGFVALLVYAVVPLCGQSLTALDHAWGPAHYLLLIPWVVFMAYSEGYRGFQRRFSPRLAARAVHLRDHTTPSRLLLAPLFCMAFFHAPRRRRIATVVLTFMIIAMVMLFRAIPQPWRGILDFGVVIGLTWGTLVTLYFAAAFWTSAEVPFNAEVVDPPARRFRRSR